MDAPTQAVRLSLLHPTSTLDEDNPVMLSPQEEVDEFIQGHLSLQKLKEMSKLNDVSIIRQLELSVDLRRTSLTGLGHILPQLVQLNFCHSFVPCIREIGSGYPNLTILKLAQCSLVDLDGIASLGQLKEIYLPGNDISDISPLAFVENLTIVDLRGNQIEDVSQLEQLVLCNQLEILCVQDNPIMAAESTEATVQFLRDTFPLAKLNPDYIDAPPLVTIHLSTDKRPPSASKTRPTSARQRDSMSRYTQGWTSDTSSSLTHGTGEIMAGNPVLFLRSWKSKTSKKDSVFSEEDIPQPTPPSQPRPPSSASLRSQRLLRPAS